MDGIITVVSAVVAFLITGLLGFLVIPKLHKMKFGQTILDIGPNWHQSKQGTPTMGGIMFIIGTTVALGVSVALAFILGDNALHSQLISLFDQNRIWVMRFIAGSLMAIGFGVIGFIDDYIKVVKKRNLGLNEKQKTLLQLIVAAAFLGTQIAFGDTVVKIPFIGSFDAAKGFGMIYWPIALLFIYGFVNSVNLTDGIDGLCSSVTLVVSIFYIMFSGFLGICVLNIYGCAIAGAMGGFLIWNLKPAKVFMGDTGSLFLGGAVVAMAFMSGYPILLILSGVIYLLEALSDIIQVTYYKKTKKRIFKMAPIHHHFEMCGWSENKIVVIFSSVDIVGCAIAFLLYFLGRN